MQNPQAKRYILPFSPRSGDLSNTEVEAAAVYALAQLDRPKGGGFLRQTKERLLFISKIGYPLWLFPYGGSALVFDGLGDFNYPFSYFEPPSAIAFQESLQEHLGTREDYMAFLTDHENYFSQPTKAENFALKGLISQSDFKEEFATYRREAIDTTLKPPNLVLLPSTLQEAAVSAMLFELGKRQTKLREDEERLPECQRLLSKTTGQFISDLDFAAEAATDELNAKIKAMEELVNPKVARLNSDYKRQIMQTTKSFDDEVESLGKLRAKTLRFIESDEQKIREFDLEEKAQAHKGHMIYAKSWKEKGRLAKKELSGLEKELKRIDKNAKTLSKQKTDKIAKLQVALEMEVNHAKAPLVELEIAKDRKTSAFKHETLLLLDKEKPVSDGLIDAIQLGEAVEADFRMLGFSDPQLRSPALFYVPFYVASYESGPSLRYLFVAPTAASSEDFGSKLRGVLGMSKIKRLLTPRFQAISGLTEQLQALGRQTDQIRIAGEKNNLLAASPTRQNIVTGLLSLRAHGWVSDKEYQILVSSLH